MSSKVRLSSPCTLLHGQNLDGVVAGILEMAGFNLTHVDDAHLCCGPSGTYSISQSNLSQQLLNIKLRTLEVGQLDVIAIANVDCQMYMAQRPVYQ